MSDTSTSDTNAIDKARKSTTSVNYGSGYSGFLKSTIGQVGGLLLFVVVGSILLYSCKVAQSNLLPTCSTAEPYSNVAIQIQQIAADINIVKNANGEFSTKILFNVEENKQHINKVLGVLNQWKYGVGATSFKLYVASILGDLIAFQFKLRTMILNLLNSIFSESLIVFLGIFIVPIIESINYIVSLFYTIFLWFARIHMLFSEPVATEKGTTWKDGNMWGLTSWYWSLIIIFLVFMLLMTIGITLIIPILVALISGFCMFFPLFIKATFKDKPDRVYGVSETIKNMFKFKLGVIMILASLFVILNASSHLGAYSAVLAVVACAILYFFTPTYKSYAAKPTDFSTFGLGTYTQATKNCVTPFVPK
jgi:hypothetical protein